MLIAILSGCGGPVTRGPADLEMRLIVEPDPPIVGGAQLHIDVTDLKWTPVNGVSVSVTGIRMDERGEPFQAALVDAEAFVLGLLGIDILQIHRLIERVA